MKKAIVIGASSGIGRSLARKLVDNGYRVGITGRRKNLLLEIQKGNPNAYIVADFDISEMLRTNEKLTDLITKLGGLDLLVFSSGIGDLNNELAFRVDQDVISTNIFGFTQIVNWSFNLFKEQGFGHLVCITSIAGMRGSRHAPSYNASKAYQINYLEALRQKINNEGLLMYITDVRPGFVDTAMAKGDKLFWKVPVEKAVQQIYDSIKIQKEIVYISKRWGLVAFIYKNLPKWVYEKI